MKLKKLLAAALLVLLLAGGWQRERRLASQVRSLEREARHLSFLVTALYAQLAEAEARLAGIEDFLRPVRVEASEVTAYAPFDPRAAAGACHDGNPHVTASGEQPVPGRTAAAGPDFPLGSIVYVAGRGWYRVNDRGGGVRGTSLDLAVQSVEEAFAFGRRRLPVLVVPPQKNNLP